MVVIDSRKLTDAPTAHDYLQQVLHLPDYYGKNLDALYDCLTEGTHHIVVAHVAEAGAYYESLRPVLMDSADNHEGTTVKEENGAVRRCRLRDKFKRKV